MNLSASRRTRTTVSDRARHHVRAASHASILRPRTRVPARHPRRGRTEARDEPGGYRPAARSIGAVVQDLAVAGTPSASQGCARMPRIQILLVPRQLENRMVEPFPACHVSGQAVVTVRLVAVSCIRLQPSGWGESEKTVQERAWHFHPSAKSPEHQVMHRGQLRGSREGWLRVGAGAPRGLPGRRGRWWAGGRGGRGSSHGEPGPPTGRCRRRRSPCALLRRAGPARRRSRRGRGGCLASARRTTGSSRSSGSIPRLRWSSSSVRSSSRTMRSSRLQPRARRSPASPPPPPRRGRSWSCARPRKSSTPSRPSPGRSPRRVPIAISSSPGS